MYSIYLKNYYQGSKMVRDETLLYTVPIRENQYDNVLTEPTVSTEIGKTGTFEFTMNPNHPYYHAIAQMRTIMRVEYDGDTIFHGRILTVDNTLTGVKKVHCEGDMAFLLDSFQMASEKADRKKIKLSEYLAKVLEAHNKQMNEEQEWLKATEPTGNSHYTQPGYSISDPTNNGSFPGRTDRTDEHIYTPGETAISGTIPTSIESSASEAEKEEETSDKCIYPGYLPGSYPEDFDDIQKIDDVTDTFGSDSHQQTMSALEALTKEYGGFFRTRYSAEDGKIYLDWCRNWFRKDVENSQPIAITKNIIDAQSNSEVDNIFTALIPVGKKKGKDIFIKGYKESIHGKGNNRILVPQITDAYSAEELNTGYVTKEIYEEAVNRYGIIYKVQTFSNADTQEKLWNYACDWIKNNYVGGITDYDLSAVDMHHVNGEIVKYIAGDCVPLVLPSDMTEYDEYNPNKRSSSILRTLTSIKYVLHNPDKNSYTAGIPNDILSVEYGTTSTSKSKAASSGGGKGAGGKGGPKNPKNQNDEEEAKARQEALDSLAYELVVSASYNSDEYKALEKKDEKKATAALQTTKMVVKKILDDDPENPKFDEQKITTMVMDGEKGKLSMIPPSDAQEIFYRMYGDGWQNNPAYLAMISTNESFVNATNGMLLDAGKKALELRGNSTMTKDQIENAIKAATESGEITGDETPEEFIAKIEDLTGEVVDPNVVAAIRTTIDGDGNEAGLISLNNEDKPTFEADGGGNEGSGTLRLGNDALSGEWLISANAPLQYQDEKGVTHTIPNGTVDASNFAELKSAVGNSIPSFSTKIAVMDEVYSEKITAIEAHFESIDAAIGRFTAIESKIITTDNIQAKFAQITGAIQFGPGGTSISGGTVSCTNMNSNTLKVHDIAYTWHTARVALANGEAKSLQYLGAD